MNKNGNAKIRRYVNKVYGLVKVKVKVFLKYGLTKKLKIDLMNVSRYKDPEINKYSFFMFKEYNFVSSI